MSVSFDGPKFVLHVPDGDGNRAQLVAVLYSDPGLDRPVSIFLQSDPMAPRESDPWADSVDLTFEDVRFLHSFLTALLENGPIA
jgi:hypothetical protein